MYSVVNPDHVQFSKGARVLVGVPNAAKGACTPVGLIGADVSLSIEKTYRVKNDHFPEVPVAQAIATLSLNVNVVLRELNKKNFQYALDVANSDVTDVAASTVNVVDEAYKMPATGQLAVTIPRTGLTNIVVDDDQGSPHTVNTDYVVVETPTTTMIVATSGGGISANDDLEISYDYTPTAHSTMPLGHSGVRTPYGVWIEEEFTGSATSKIEYQINRAFLGVADGFDINSAENGGDLPLLIEAALQSGQSTLGTAYFYA